MPEIPEEEVSVAYDGDENNHSKGPHKRPL